MALLSYDFLRQVEFILSAEKPANLLVTVLTGNGIKGVAEFMFCQGCGHFHITLGEPAPEITLEELRALRVNNPAFGEDKDGQKATGASEGSGTSSTERGKEGS